MTEYAELHAHSNFSFLDGASHPEALVKEAARLGLAALAICDHNGLYAAVRTAQAARKVGLATVFGAELTLGLTQPQDGIADPQGNHLIVLARDPQGYSSLSRVIAQAHLEGGTKGKPKIDLASLACHHGGHWLVTTACRKGAVPAALESTGPRAAGAELDRLIDAFGRENVAVEMWHHDDPLDSARNDALAHLALSRRTELIVTTNAHYATPAGHRLAGALAAIRARRSLDSMDGWLPAGPSAHLRSGSEQARRFSKFPGVVQRTGEIGLSLAFDLRLLAPGLPPFPVPLPHDEMSYLRHLVDKGGRSRYGPRGTERVPGAWEQLDHELGIIDQLGFAGYFLVVWDIVRFCRDQNIYCQGRGSAANSAVCFTLGVTNADAVSLGLLFERFLSTERDGPPDIDIDIESARREEVIQYVYRRHGRHHAAQVANVITYRSRSAVRDAAKALGHSPGSIDAWSRQLEHHAKLQQHAGPKQNAGPKQHESSHGGTKAQTATAKKDPQGDPLHDIPKPVLDLAAQMQDVPRHLGVHSGGMVICDRPVIEVCPVEWATAAGRTVLQWDKEDCAAVGLVKFDLLGLGMLEALHKTVDLIKRFYDIQIDLAMLPQESAVYEMLCRADTVGVFQVESRAQMGTLPRLKPKVFYDLVIEVALIRPGPIQGGSVHPYLRRRNGEEEVTYPHALLEPCLKKTLGVPLFQEQLMQMAIDVAGFTAAEADQLRQAMGSKRSEQRMKQLQARFYQGMEKHSITEAVADEIFAKMAAFANFGFPESHSVSFAYLVYSSAWLKLHYPAAFCASLLNSQPMGFWGPPTLIADARRHGVKVLPADVNTSAANAGLELETPQNAAIRLGLGSIKSLGEEAAQRIVDNQPYRDLEDLSQRTQLSRSQLEMLATAGATASLDGGNRRQSLWAAGAVAHLKPGQLEGLAYEATAPELPAMSKTEEVVANMWATGVSVETSIIELARPHLDELGVTMAALLADMATGCKVRVAGIVTHRQRPETARGITFVSLEDESGLLNVICSKGIWIRYRKVAQSASAMLVLGRLESANGVVNVIAERLESLELAIATRARNFA